jgi:hypothetical protein
MHKPFGRATGALTLGAVDIRLPNEVELRVVEGTDSMWLGELLRRLLACSGWGIDGLRGLVGKGAASGCTVGLRLRFLQQTT